MGQSVKRAVLEMIAGMPEDAWIEEILCAMYCREEIDASLREAGDGSTIPQEEDKRRLVRSLGSVG